MSDNELPGMWGSADFTGGQDDESNYVAPGPDGRSTGDQDEVRQALVTAHAYDSGPTKGDRCLYNCGQSEEAHERSEYPPGQDKSRAVLWAEVTLDYCTTRELLEELRIRGDLAMTVYPTSQRGSDGSALSAIASLLLSSSHPATLEANRGR